MPYKIKNVTNGHYITSSTSTKIDRTDPIYAKVYSTIKAAKGARQWYQEVDTIHYDHMIYLKSVNQWDTLYGVGQTSPIEQIKPDYQIEEF